MLDRLKSQGGKDKRIIILGFVPSDQFSEKLNRKTITVVNINQS